jgi:hypothetical protein
MVVVSVQLKRCQRLYPAFRVKVEHTVAHCSIMYAHHKPAEAHACKAFWLHTFFYDAVPGQQAVDSCRKLSFNMACARPYCMPGGMLRVERRMFDQRLLTVCPAIRRQRRSRHL